MIFSYEYHINKYNYYMPFNRNFKMTCTISHFIESYFCYIKLISFFISFLYMNNYCYFVYVYIYI